MKLNFRDNKLFYFILFSFIAGGAVFGILMHKEKVKYGKIDGQRNLHRYRSVDSTTSPCVRVSMKKSKLSDVSLQNKVILIGTVTAKLVIKKDINNPANDLNEIVPSVKSHSTTSGKQGNLYVLVKNDKRMAMMVSGFLYLIN